MGVTDFEKQTKLVALCQKNLQTEEKEFYFKATYMTSQATPRGHHPGPLRGEVLGTLISFQCQAKTVKGTEVLTSVMVMTKGYSCAHRP
jgi:hypothetical protein